MSIVKIRAAMEKHLAALTPAMPTAWENAPFAPVVGVAYQSVHLLHNDPLNPTLAQSVVIERGILQVSLHYPVGAGPNAAAARAMLLRQHFPAGLALHEGGVTVRIERTPAIATAMLDEGRHVVPVSIRYQAITRN